MRFIKRLIILSLCSFLGSCFSNDELIIDIGDYEGHLAAWNSQNMLDYEILVSYGINPPEVALITVRNGIPESFDSSQAWYWDYENWVKYNRKSTIPEFYSYIKELEKRVEKDFKDNQDNGVNKSISLNVSYNTKYHYPSEIITEYGNYTNRYISISLSPLGKLEIDIGDYEGHLAAWNSRNMLDYHLDVASDGFADYLDFHVLIYVENGITKRITEITHLDDWIKDNYIMTIPEFYSFIKSREEFLTHHYYFTHERVSLTLKVSYDTEYHYPREIIIRGYNDEDWNITLTPPGE